MTTVLFIPLHPFFQVKQILQANHHQLAILSAWERIAGKDKEEKEKGKSSNEQLLLLSNCSAHKCGK